MNNPDILQWLQQKSAAVGVLPTREHTNATMTYGDFTRAISLRRGDEAWHARHRTLVSKMLYLLAAAERQVGEPRLPYQRIVTQDGEPGQGNYRESRVVVGPIRADAGLDASVGEAS